MKTNKWKLAVLVWSAMFPSSTAISYGLAWLSFPSQWPLVARTFCLTGILVPFMVFGALPFLNRRFQRWLQLPDRESITPENQTIERIDTQPAGADPNRLRTTDTVLYKAYPHLTANGAET